MLYIIMYSKYITQWFDIHIHYKMINFTVLYPSIQYDPISTSTIKWINQKTWKNVMPIDKEINMVGFKYSTDVETNHGVLKITTK